MKSIMLLLLIITLSACSREEFTDIDRDEATSVINQSGSVYPYVPCYATDSAIHDYYEIFVTVEKIHENMPEFTFRRIVGDFIDNPWHELPVPREVNIIIEDEGGYTIQVISGLTQSNTVLIFGDAYCGIIFDDFNFDGYLDMRLVRWTDGGGSLRSISYVWLWDIAESQFVLNEQLVGLDAAEITTNQDIRQIETWIRHSDGRTYSYYEFHNEELILVAYDRLFRIWDEHGYPSHAEVVRTNVLTSDVTIEINPYGW